MAMGFIRKIAERAGLVDYRAEDGHTIESHIAPPSRSNTVLNTSTALSISTVYRAVQILATSAGQLPIYVERNGTKLTTAQTPNLVLTPSLDMDRVDFIEQSVTSLATAGNAYWKLHRVEGMGVVNVEILNPHEVEPVQDDKGNIEYHHGGKTIRATDMKHLKLMGLPGSVKGLGPIQAARVELTGALNLRDYASNWFDNAIPEALLTTDQAVTQQDAETYLNIWEEGTKKGRRLRVLGKGLKFEPIMLNPADAQWLENQQFTTTQMARLFGTPASLMLASVEGSAMTYQNVEQDWIAFVRFTLMGYLRKIENALSDLVVRGQDVRFNIEALLRTDTLTRYQAHGLALSNRWMDVDEVRGIENLPPLTEEQRQRIKDSAPASAPNAAGAVTPNGEPA